MTENLAIKLDLQRPIIIFDLETTGLSLTSDKIAQLAYLKHFPDGVIEQKKQLFNPGKPMPTEALAVHGLSDELLKDAPAFASQAVALADVFKDSYYSGFNVARYDLPLLRQEFIRAGVNFNFKPEDIIDAKIVYHHMERRDLASAYKFYCGKEHTEAHDAMADVEVTAEIIAEQATRYGYDEIKRIHDEECRDYIDADGKFMRKDGEIYFAFSKFKDQSLSSVAQSDPTFLRWILQADFPQDTKDVVRNFLKEQQTIA